MRKEVHNKALLDMTGFAEKYAADKSIVKKFADENGVSIVTVYNRMKELGIRRRTQSEVAAGGTMFRENNPNWGGGLTRSNGYILESRDGVRRFQHRLVAEKMLGRPLTGKEVVHHKNGIRDDNRPENLQVLPSNAAHMKFHCDSDVMRARGALGLKARYAKASLKARA